MRRQGGDSILSVFCLSGTVSRAATNRLQACHGRSFSPNRVVAEQNVQCHIFHPLATAVLHCFPIQGITNHRSGQASTKYHLHHISEQSRTTIDHLTIQWMNRPTWLIDIAHFLPKMNYFYMLSGQIWDPQWNIGDEAIQFCMVHNTYA